MNRHLLLLILSLGVLWPPLAAQAEEKVVTLPSSPKKSEISLDEVLWRRRSIRQFAERPLDVKDIGRLCFAAAGISDKARGFRTAPSAGALYPLELHLVSSQGRHRYLPDSHSLRLELSEDPRLALARGALSQESVRQAPCVFVISAVVSRTRAKYADRSERYVFMEAGHAAQNLLLQAAALGLGAVPIGAFEDHKVHQALHLRAAETPLYLIPVGYPRR